MIWRNTEDSFGAIHKAFHWVMALLIIGMLCVGIYMTQQEPSPQVFQIYALHKSIGILILALAVLRLIWRYSNIHPRALPSHKVWEKRLATLVHAMLYLSFFLMPLSGWVMSSAKGFSVSVFNLFTLPDFVARNDDLSALANTVHEFAGYTLIGIIGLHAAGAIKHHVIDCDITLRRMLPVLAFLAILFPLQVQAADAPVWKILKDQSTLTFTATQMGADFDGSFGSFDGMITFDPDNLVGSKADITISIDSIEANSTDRNKYVRMEDWFNAAQFPDAHFVTKSITKGLDISQYVATGELTIRDVTMPVTLPFTLTIAEDPATKAMIATMAGGTTLNRLDFGVGQGQWKDTKSVGAEVIVRVSLKAQRQ